MNRKLIFLSVGLVFILSACSILPGSGGDELAGTAWSLERFGGKALLPGSTMTAVFEDGQVSGSASCNHYFAAYEENGSQLSIEGLGWTEMACLDPEGIMEQEQEIMRLLGAADAFEIQGSRLFIRSAGGQELIFVPLETDLDVGRNPNDHCKL